MKFIQHVHALFRSIREAQRDTSRNGRAILHTSRSRLLLHQELTPAELTYRRFTSLIHLLKVSLGYWLKGWLVAD